MESTLDVQLADQISVFELQALLAGVDKIYFSALWLELADSMPPGQIFPDAYAPAPDKNVWIAALEIGTPNWLSLKGQTKQIALVAAFLTTVLGIPVAGTEALKNYAEAQKAFVESDLHRLEIVEKAERLYREGKISEAALRHKLNLAEELIESIAVTRTIVPPQTIEIAPVDVVGGSDSAAFPEPTIRVESVLNKIGKPDATKPAVEFLKAQKAFASKRDAGSQQDLQRAYARLASALAPMPDSEIHHLIEDLLREA
ncbi:hypothetical protein LJR175_007625 [Variovorax sp. LjRoot175]|uniref:hypothetical protein n=1 Tax=Variovorax sp. LjRoot175 TaxID=3342276 RepID=UPI003ECD58E4